MAEIETRPFRYFVALAENRHFGRAALSLGIGTPTLSNQIKKLETQLNARLVTRKGNTGIELTVVGIRFLDRARRVLREAAEAEAIARQAARGEMAASPMAPTSMIYRSDEASPAALAFIKFMRQHAISEKQDSD
jgi:DNA-binding transcriptional LysR family regulator